MSTTIRVIGGGLAGCEAAFQLANQGFLVELHEMKPSKRTPAQVSDHLAELVCSNSFRSNSPTNAVGLIKEEMRRAGGFLMRIAEIAKVPAGDALAVDREVFGSTVEKELNAHPNITLVAGEVSALPTDGVPTIVCTGPLTADALAEDIARVSGRDRLAFYDAIAPIIEAESVDMSSAFFKSRRDKGGADDYLNCPMNEEEFKVFYDALLAADAVSAKEFEKLHYFEGCLPIEVLASRGEKTLLFGPFKPVGLDSDDGTRHTAVIQLRKEDVHGTSYNLVGCQTRLKQPDQREVFRLVPALKDVKFLRYGAIHRNTYLDAPSLLGERNQLMVEGYEHIHFAGQITGVEGYVESTASGLLTAWLLADHLQGKAHAPPPEFTAMGGLYRHCRGEIRADKSRYEPSNITWAMMPPWPREKGKRKLGKRDRRLKLSEQALVHFDAWLQARVGDA